jgi:hypothetical protein
MGNLRTSLSVLQVALLLSGQQLLAVVKTNGVTAPVSLAT